MDPAGPCGNLWLPAVSNRLEISRTCLLFDTHEQNFHPLERELRVMARITKVETGGRQKACPERNLI